MSITNFALLALSLACAVSTLNAADAIDAAARKVEVRLIEHRIEMPKEIAAGKTAFVVTNAGQKEHSFGIDGGGVNSKLPGTLDAGESKTLQIDLKPGTYRVYCPVGEHAMRGMERNLIVK
ncbi:MAG: hypothetical protein JWM88_1072 [Verrucomicrobia bacterium]|nr:hypothetical protein [Verrucomicrobiota bacterium]